MRRALIWAPLALFAIVAALAMAGLFQPGDRTIRSRLVGKPLPHFALPASVPGKPGVSAAGFRAGEPRLLNVFGSWCVPCIAEAPQLGEIAAAGVPIDGLAIRDRGPDVARFLSQHGDPFAAIGDDPESAVQLALGSAGVPETFVIDGRGVIRHQHVGPIRDEDVPVLIAAWKDAQ